MKKYLLFIAAAATLVACDPVEDRDSFSKSVVDANQLNEGLTFVQRDAEGNIAEDGNYISYSTNPSTVVCIYTLKNDGSENQLALGASGEFVLSPNRGSDPNQTLYVRAYNTGGEFTTIERQLYVYVPTDLPAEMKLAVADSGEKIWKWDTNAPDGVVWGNMGYCGGSADWTKETAGKWWGVTSEEEFMDQLNHSNTGTATGEESMDAYMVWKEDGSLLKYDASGNLINSGSFEIADYDPNAEWRKGLLKTSEGAILWPFEINSGGRRPTEFDIVHLSVNQMVLVYPDGGAFDGLGAWGEASFWRFASNSDVEGTTAGYSEEGTAWTWNTDCPNGGVVWGNMGYCGGNGADVYTGNGKWWGVTSEEEFMGQLGHSNTGVATGEESMDAYMLFKPSGDLLKYDATGNLLNTGSFKFDTSVANEWKVANLETSAGAILWPFEINSGGNRPTTFEVVYLSGSAMTLVYPDGGAFDGLGAWGEASFWQFKKK
ncbi:MAG: hypothetical protein IJ635_08860 [Bacteroidaceae bacterium]|nr:hypothetical protein [Bacteroidaceae bacterium]